MSALESCHVPARLMCVISHAERDKIGSIMHEKKHGSEVIVGKWWCAEQGWVGERHCQDWGRTGVEEVWRLLELSWDRFKDKYSSWFGSCSKKTGFHLHYAFEGIFDLIVPACVHNSMPLTLNAGSRGLGSVFILINSQFLIQTDMFCHFKMHVLHLCYHRLFKWLVQHHLKHCLAYCFSYRSTRFLF